MLPGIRHPYHLNLVHNKIIQFSETETKVITSEFEYKETLRIDLPDIPAFEFDDRCDYCGKMLGKTFYRCLVCGFSLDGSCISKYPPFTITNPKNHQHPLTLFPRPLSAACSACGLGDKNEEPGYVCLPCNYVVHESCINLPRVIKLTRHPHRLSFTPCLLPPARRSCGVCHRNINVKFGMYSCNKGCSYAVHSKCSTHRDIWDGIYLEGVPEEPEEDLSPFMEVGYNLIKYFSHEHHLGFDEDGLTLGGNKDCQVCCRSIDSGGFYRCTILHCYFFLHASCANFPKKKEHPVHKHPLILQSSQQYAVIDIGYGCFSCRRVCNGFSYTCVDKSCKDENGNHFQMDVTCASVCEPFEHKVHPHPMLLYQN